ncbi:MAG TPA: hypothetical protein VFV84_12335 [Burkholderiales bacterium]|nr:hypothetical protein [Burkholderiales bacterium]
MAARNAPRRAARAGAPPLTAFSLPLRLAAGIVHWDAITLKPIPGPSPRARRSGR